MKDELRQVVESLARLLGDEEMDLAMRVTLAESMSIDLRDLVEQMADTSEEREKLKEEIRKRLRLETLRHSLFRPSKSQEEIDAMAAERTLLSPGPQDTARPITVVYYYECSGGDFRLECHLPREKLMEVETAREGPSSLTEGFPDGLDIRCSAADVQALERQYGCRLPISADAARDAFLAAWSTTNRWRRFRGSGLVSGTVMERWIDTVEGWLETVPTQQDEANRATSWRARRRLADQREKTLDMLEERPMPGLDPARPINDQPELELIAWSSGRPALEIFESLHQGEGPTRSGG